MEGKNSLLFEEAIDTINRTIRPIQQTELINLENGLNRILAMDIISPISTPSFNRSPLDGYALLHQDIAKATKKAPATLRVIEKVYAGDCPTKTITPGTAVRIMTGGMLPLGCTCVIRQEDTDYGEDQVQIYASLKEQANVIFAGEDILAEHLILTKGRRLGSVELALLSSMGICRINVLAKPKIAVFNTGSEICAPGEMLPPGKIYDTNLAYVTSRLKEFQFDCRVKGFIRDSEAELQETLTSAAANTELIITTGGVSVGQKDLLHAVSARHQRIFWKVKLKPGSAVLFWQLGQVPVLSLSGNPFAAAATFELFVRPALAKLTQDQSVLTRQATGILKNDFAKASHGRRFIRGSYANGQVFLPEIHSSGVLATMLDCNCLVDIPPKSPPLAKGESVQVVLI